MTDQTPDLAALEALAEAATPGPWTAYGMTGVTSDDYEVAPEYHYTCDGCASEVIISPIIDHETAAYIAAADPQTVLWLIREVERLQYEVSETQTDLDNEREYRDLDDQTAELRADVIREEWQIARARAEKAEATIERARELADSWAGSRSDLGPVTRACGALLRAALDGGEPDA